MMSMLCRLLPLYMLPCKSEASPFFQEVKVFFPPLVQLTPAQRQLFVYIEDFDLWRFALPNTKAFQAGLIAQV